MPRQRLSREDILNYVRYVPCLAGWCYLLLISTVYKVPVAVVWATGCAETAIASGAVRGIVVKLAGSLVKGATESSLVFLTSVRDSTSDPPASVILAARKEKDCYSAAKSAALKHLAALAPR